MPRIVAKLLAGLFCAAGAWGLAVGLFITTASLPEDFSARFAASWLFLGGVPLAAGIGLWRGRAWSRWFFLLTALTWTTLFVANTPRIWEMYQHHKHPPEGAYDVLTDDGFLQLLQRFAIEPLVLVLVLAAAALLVFRHFRRAGSPPVPPLQ